MLINLLLNKHFLDIRLDSYQIVAHFPFLSNIIEIELSIYQKIFIHLLFSFHDRRLMSILNLYGILYHFIFVKIVLNFIINLKSFNRIFSCLKQN